MGRFIPPPNLKKDLISSDKPAQALKRRFVPKNDLLMSFFA
jgi:hypothetical protein